jgi:hypothetical protein
VLWIDHREAETLRRWMASGALVTGAPPYVALRLKNKKEET